MEKQDVIMRQIKNIQIKIKSLKDGAPGMVGAARQCVRSDVFSCFQVVGLEFSLFRFLKKEEMTFPVRMEVSYRSKQNAHFFLEESFHSGSL